MKSLPLRVLLLSVLCYLRPMLQSAAHVGVVVPAAILSGAVLARACGAALPRTVDPAAPAAADTSAAASTAAAAVSRDLAWRRILLVAAWTPGSATSGRESVSTPNAPLDRLAAAEAAPSAAASGPAAATDVAPSAHAATVAPRAAAATPRRLISVAAASSSSPVAAAVSSWAATLARLDASARVPPNTAAAAAITAPGASAISSPPVASVKFELPLRMWFKARDTRRRDFLHPLWSWYVFFACAKAAAPANQCHARGGNPTCCSRSASCTWRSNGSGSRTLWVRLVAAAVAPHLSWGSRSLCSSTRTGVYHFLLTEATRRLPSPAVPSAFREEARCGAFDAGLQPQATAAADVPATAQRALLQQKPAYSWQQQLHRRLLLQQQKPQRCVSLPRQLQERGLLHRTTERTAGQSRGGSSSGSSGDSSIGSRSGSSSGTDASGCFSVGLLTCSAPVATWEQRGDSNSSHRSCSPLVIGKTRSSSQRCRSAVYLAQGSCSSSSSSDWFRNKSQRTRVRKSHFISSNGNGKTEQWAVSQRLRRSLLSKEVSSGTACTSRSPTRDRSGQNSSDTNSSSSSRWINSTPPRDSSSGPVCRTHRLTSYLTSSSHLTLDQRRDTACRSSTRRSSSTAFKSSRCASSSRRLRAPPGSSFAHPWALASSRVWDSNSTTWVGEGKDVPRYPSSVCICRLRSMISAAASSARAATGQDGHGSGAGGEAGASPPPGGSDGGRSGAAAVEGETASGFRVIQRDATVRFPLRWLHFDRVDSTQQWALRNLPRLQEYGLSASQWVVVSASEQTAAVGTRHGSSPQPAKWISPPNNVSATYVIPWPVSLSGRLISFPQTAAAAVCQLLQDMQLDPKMKWINDVLVNDRKIAGILCANPSFYISATPAHDVGRGQQQPQQRQAEAAAGNQEQCIGVLVGVGVNLEKAPNTQQMAGGPGTTQAAICVAEALQEKRRQQQSHVAADFLPVEGSRGVAAAAGSSPGHPSGGGDARIPSHDMFDVAEALHAKMFECFRQLQCEGFPALRPFLMSRLAWLGEYVELESEDGHPAPQAAAAAAAEATAAKYSLKPQAETQTREDQTRVQPSKQPAALPLTELTGSKSSQLTGGLPAAAATPGRPAPGGDQPSKQTAAGSAPGTSAPQASSSKQLHAVAAAAEAAGGDKSSKLTTTVPAAGSAHGPATGDKASKLTSAVPAAAGAPEPAAGDKSSKLTSAVPAAAGAPEPAAGDKPSKLTSAVPAAAAGAHGPAAGDEPSKLMAAVPGGTAAAEQQASKLTHVVPTRAEAAGGAGEERERGPHAEEPVGQAAAEEADSGEFQGEEEREEEFHTDVDGFGESRRFEHTATAAYGGGDGGTGPEVQLGEKSSSSSGEPYRPRSSKTGREILAAGILQGLDLDGALLIKEANGEVTRHMCGHLIRP